MNNPSFIIVGECKCGTTSLYDMLTQHPKILKSLGNGEKTKTNDNQLLGKKELRFFDKYYENGINWYRDCFPFCKIGEITGEASPTYLFNRSSIRRIKNHFPEIKIIVSIRNPIDRLISHFYHLCSIDKKFKQKYNNNLFDYLFSSSSSFLGEDSHLLLRGHYFLSIDFLANFFPEKNIFILKAEDLFSNPQEKISKVFNFLNVKDFEITPSHLRSTNKPALPKIIKKTLSEHYNNSMRVLSERYRISW
jgi:hypothetical protein